MDDYINNVSLWWDSPYTTEAYKVLVWTDRIILDRYRSKPILEEEFTRYMNKTLLEKGHLISYQNHLVHALPNNYKTHLWKDCHLFTYPARFACTQKYEVSGDQYSVESASETNDTKLHYNLELYIMQQTCAYQSNLFYIHMFILHINKLCII